MEVSFKKRFSKDLSKIPNAYAEGIKKVVFKDIPHATSLSDITLHEKNCVKFVL